MFYQEITSLTIRYYHINFNTLLHVSGVLTIGKLLDQTGYQVTCKKAKDLVDLITTDYKINHFT